MGMQSSVKVHAVLSLLILVDFHVFILKTVKFSLYNTDFNGEWEQMFS